jgi:hypothetical protein
MIAPSPFVLAIGALVAAAAGAAAGYRYAAAQGAARLAECRAEASAAREAAARDAADRFAVAARAEREAVARLTRTEETLHDTQHRLRQALARAARADRVCLAPDTRRLLDDARSGADRLPETSGGAPRAAAAAPAPASGSDDRGTSERAVAEWIAEAMRLYDTCRARLAALRHWSEAIDGR